MDLCSGTGGPLIKIQHDMNKYEQFDVKVTLTDLYPPTAQVKNLVSSQLHHLLYQHKNNTNDLTFISSALQLIELQVQKEIAERSHGHVQYYNVSSNF